MFVRIQQNIGVNFSITEQFVEILNETKLYCIALLSTVVDVVRCVIRRNPIGITQAKYK